MNTKEWQAYHTESSLPVVPGCVVFVTRSNRRATVHKVKGRMACVAYDDGCTDVIPLAAVVRVPAAL